MVVRLLAVALAAGTLAGCGDAYRYLTSGPVGRALKQEVRDRGASRVVLSQLTTFAWDQLFLFPPYMPKERVCAALAIPLPDCDRVIEDAAVDDGVMLLVFRRAGEVVHAEVHYRVHGDFIPLPEVQPIARGKAVFRVQEDGRSASGVPWIRLVQE